MIEFEYFVDKHSSRDTTKFDEFIVKCNEADSFCKMNDGCSIKIVNIVLEYSSLF